jgi:molybdopterin converting factor small subunit
VLAVCGSLPAVAGTAEQNQIIQIQATMQMLQDNMARMQQSLDERMGVMKVLMTQQTENVNKMGVAVQNLQKSLGAQTTDNATKVDQISGQMKAMHDSVDELKARMAKLDKQLNDMQSAQRNIVSPPAGAPGGNAAPSPARPVK